MTTEARVAPLRRDPSSAIVVLATLWRSWVARVGVVALAVLVLVAVFAGQVAPRDPAAQDLVRVFDPPSATYWFGTDDLGRDVFSRVVWGARVSLVVGFVAVGIAAVAGILIGMVAGYRGGWFDELLMRAMDAIWALPSLVLALAIVAAIGPSLTNAMIAIGIVYTPAFARLARAEVIRIKELDFVAAARAAGATAPRILGSHLWPNATGPLVVQITYYISQAILIEASLSFLGLGVQPPTPSWGSMLQQNYTYVELAPWASVLPGAAIFVAVLAINAVGDGLRDALDVRLREAR